jgi:predicted transposase YdaD
MRKPFDAAGKKLVDVDPLGWVRFLGLQGSSASVLDGEMSTPMTADRVIRVSDPDYLAHIELQTTYDTNMGHRLLAYNVAAGYKFGMPAESVVVLLRKEADGPAISGQFQFGPVQFAFHVVRIWERSAEELLAGPFALLPLAPIANVELSEMPGLIRRMQSRLDAATPAFEKDLWMITHLLMGLKFGPEQTHDFLRGVFQMLDLRVSTTYQSILKEGEATGEAKGERQVLFLIGSKRFGEPDAATRAAIETITSPQRLEELAGRLLEVSSWADLLR